MAAPLARALRGTLLLVAAAPASAQTTVTELIERTSPAVVSVEVLFKKVNSAGRKAANSPDAVRIERPGSGTFVSASGLVLTNAHLVEEVREDSDEYWLRIGLGWGFRDAEVLFRDEVADLALLQVELLPNDDIVALPLGSSADQISGSRVLAIGSPAGEQGGAFAGALAFASGPVQLREALLEPWQALLSDCRFHETLDGGPLLNAKGELVGIHNSSHLNPLPESWGEDEEDEEEKKPDTDYAVIVSSDAIRASIGAHLEAAETLPGLLSTEAHDAAAPAAVARVAPAVVSIWHGPEQEHPDAADPTDPQSQRLPATLGSGVVIDPSGLVLTTREILGDLDAGTSVRTADGTRYAAKVVKRHADSQTALLQLELPEAATLPAAEMLDSSKIAAGDFTAVVARPFHAAVNLSVGVLSAAEREGFVQLASWVHPGHRGGAVVDPEGRLIGIVVEEPDISERADEDSFLGFAAPLSTVFAAFEGSLRGLGSSAALTQAPEAPPTAVETVASSTRSSLINVMVSKAVETKSSGFDPFGGGGAGGFKMLGQGSGVIIEETGLALSNWHVVDAALTDDGTQGEDFKIEVSLPDGRSFEARVLSTSRDDDLSLLSLQIGPEDVLVPVELGDSDQLEPGQPVVAIGNPLGLSNSVSAGIISAVDVDTRIRGRLRAYAGMAMTDAAINPGNSGGALLDLEGRLVGINTAGSVGAGLAIPVNKAREVFSGKLLSARSLRTAYLGLTVAERDGHLVAGRVHGEGPAERAGVRRGDRLLRLAGQATPTQAAYARLILDLDTTAPCALVVEREGEELSLELLPISFATWEIARSCGIEVAELDYTAQAERIQEASVLLHRAYTQNESGEPTRLMAGALEVVRVSSLPDEDPPLLQPGDLLLGITTFEHGTTAIHERLLRLEDLATLSETITPLATKDGGAHTFWVLRGERIETVEVIVRRPPR